MSSRVLNAASVRCDPICWGELGPTQPPIPAGGACSGSLQPEPASPPDDWERQLELAREEGRREAGQAARQAVEQEVAALRGQLIRSIESIAALRPKLRREAEGQLVELALAIGRRVLHRELTVDPSAIAGLVRSALDGLTLRELVGVRAHPALAPAIEAEIRRAGAPTAVRIEADQSLEAGAVLIETTYGVLDASISTQLEEIERGFSDLLSNSALTKP